MFLNETLITLLSLTLFPQACCCFLCFMLALAVFIFQEALRYQSQGLHVALLNMPPGTQSKPS